MRLLKWLRNLFYGPVGKSDMGKLDHHGQFEETRYKILFNPFENCYMWSKLNTVTHVWEWQEKATHNEVFNWLKEPAEIQQYGFPVSHLLIKIQEYGVVNPMPWEKNND